jgi:hypothetical protein
MKETNVAEFRIENVPHNLFMTFLEYLVRRLSLSLSVCVSGRSQADGRRQYTGEVQLNPDLAQEMLRVSDMYGCQRLKALCEYELKDCIDDHTVAQLFHMADMYSAPSLRAICLSYMVRRAAGGGGGGGGGGLTVCGRCCTSTRSS